MDTYEATNILLSKIRSIDPENASRIMGFILIQGLAEKDLLRLACGPETLLQNVVLKAKIGLGLPPNTFSALSAPSSPSPLNPIARPNTNTNPFSQSSPRLTNNGSFVDFAKNPSPQQWPVPGLPSNNNNNTSLSPKSSPFLSYDNIRAGSPLVPPSSNNGSGDCSGNSGDFLDEYQLDEYLSFLDDSTSKREELLDPRVHLDGYSVTNGDTHLHRRRFSESDACFGAEDVVFGVGYRPCMYFARGFCKNGDSCKFVHGVFGGDNVADVNGPAVIVGSPREMEDLYLQQQEEMMRMRVAQQQQEERLAYSKRMNFLLQQQNDHQRLGAAAAMMSDEFHKFGRFHRERNDILAMGMVEKANSASRQIYLTFPADSSFKDEDVSNYFNTFGPVQDVRIPYQVKRMFGFVTFVRPETVKLILARGNPHFICDSRVLVKPYKEKGKVANKAQQLLERGNFSPSSSPTGLYPRELYDLNLGTRMLYGPQEMMLRQKLEEQAEMQQALEFQGRRLINLQLPDLRGDYIPRHQRSLSVGAPFSPPTHTPFNQNVILTSNGKTQEVLEADNGDRSAPALSSTTAAADEQNLEHESNATHIQSNGTVNGMEERFNECYGSKVENVLHDNLFASPKKPSVNQHLEVSPTLVEVKESTDFCVTSSSSENNASVATNSTSDVASH